MSSQSQGLVLIAASPHVDSLFAARANLNVGSKASQLIFLLLVAKFSFAPNLVVLLPVVLRNAHDLVSAGKSMSILF